MFRIIGFERTDGKIRVVVETDDNTTVFLLRLFAEAEKFAHLLHYRMTTESRLDESRKSAPEKTARLRRNRAELLKTFREIPGPHGLRMRILREMCIGNGVEVTLDRLTAQLTLAREEEREGKRFSVKRLIKKEKTLGEIAAALDLPKSTVARFARSLGGASKRQARVKRTVLALAERPPGPVRSPVPASTPSPVPPGRPKTA